ncbi:MAG: phytanoyl-CoA dioxygenase [Planctomycetaceae bacterium]|nr:phytanoyl-CoA dioxygenase [Planctomycetaceae bacterium]|tara:strand:+ start:104 stop:874 length:771 start_codon:yes stop_codon:yes gene_type:complete
MANTQILTNADRRQYQQDGYFILQSVLSSDQLSLLRGACDTLIAAMHDEMDRLRTNHIHISHRNERYHIAKQYNLIPNLDSYVFSELMADICRATIGPNAYLFYDQYVAKAGEKGRPFSWHQDSGYLGFDHDPYVTVWTAVDDMTIDNGTVSLLPFSTMGSRDLKTHIRDQNSGDKIGYTGDKQGVTAIVPAGSIVVFSSLTFHRSGPNTTDRMRRAYVTQYSSAPIVKPGHQEPYHLAVPFLLNDTIVYSQLNDE